MSEMDEKQLTETFSPETLTRLFPADRADSFFDALFGDAGEGAFDIDLRYSGCQGKELSFELQLKERPGKCLACHLTRGIPDVFLRHPIINIKGLVQEIGKLAGNASEPEWSLGRTREVSRSLHVVPLTIRLAG
jgi:hypothetical protein